MDIVQFNLTSLWFIISYSLPKILLEFYKNLALLNLECNEYINLISICLVAPSSFN